MAAFGQDDRILRFTSPLGDNVLLPEHLSGTEGISQLFCFRLDLVAAADKTIDPKQIVGKSVAIGIQATDSGTQRYIHGIVSSFELCGGGDNEFNNYRVWIVPALWALTLNTNTRVFQNQTVTDVIKAVLGPYSISPAIDTSVIYTPMEYCTQYRETDFNFISRLMEQHGIFYYFKHSQSDHVFTLQDTSSKLSDCTIQSTMRYAPEGTRTEGFYDFVVSEFASKSSLVTGKYTVWDYSFIRNKAVDGGDSAATKGPLGTNGNLQYDYADSAAAYLKLPKSDGKISDLAGLFMNTRRDSGDAGTVRVDGMSNAIAFMPGYTFTLSEHPQSALNVKYLINTVGHDVQQVPSYRGRTARNQTTPYTNTFTATPASIVWRPPFTTDKPVVNGMHTGQVVTPSGEDSYMDKYGRVCVQFWWDRNRQPNTPDNTLLRVAQSWAGKGWGTYFWPRVGDEVLIDFMEGDPDQPIVVGSVYNGANMPKYDPAGQYTLSGVLTRTSKNGAAANANELRFEDLQDKEQIFMNAERDYDLHVEHDWHTTVGNEQHTTIAANQFESVGGDAHRKVTGKQYEEIDGDSHLTVQGKQISQIGGDQSETVAGNRKETVGSNVSQTVGSNLSVSAASNFSMLTGQNQQLEAGQNFNATAGQNINLMGGMAVNITGGATGVSIVGPGGFISITEAGIAIMGTLVMINSGGSPTPANPAQPQNPDTPDSPTAPTAPKWPGDDPYSKPKGGD